MKVNVENLKKLLSHLEANYDNIVETFNMGCFTHNIDDIHSHDVDEFNNHDYCRTSACLVGFSTQIFPVTEVDLITRDDGLSSLDFMRYSYRIYFTLDSYQKCEKSLNAWSFLFSQGWRYDTPTRELDEAIHRIKTFIEWDGELQYKYTDLSGVTHYGPPSY